MSNLVSLNNLVTSGNNSICTNNNNNGSVILLGHNNQIMQQQQLQQSYMMQTMMAQAFGGLAGAFGQIFSGLTNAGNSSNKASMMASNDRSNGGCGPNGCPNKDTSQQAWNDNKANPPRNEATNSTNNDQTG